MPDPNSNQNKFLITIAGPTGIGKSSLAIELSKIFDCEIFSADSRQIYKEMSIGTAKPTLAEQEGIKHHFIDEISIVQEYSAGHFQNDFQLRLSEYFEQNQIAILVGGTGLYLRAATIGLDSFPDVPPQINQMLQRDFEEKGISYLQDLLKIKDPEYFSKVDIQNPRRLLRALSIINTTGKTFSSFINQAPFSIDGYEMIPILLTLDREMLYDIINKRVDKMITLGLVEEARSLHHLRGLKALETVGYQELFEYFESRINLEEAVQLVKQNSRRYAKRQITWFKKYGQWHSMEATNFLPIIQYVQNKISQAENMV